MIQSGEFLHFSLNENPFIKATDGGFSLVNLYLIESNNIHFNSKDVFLGAGLSLLGRKI